MAYRLRNPGVEQSHLLSLMGWHVINYYRTCKFCKRNLGHGRPATDFQRDAKFIEETEPYKKAVCLQI